ncbi:MAG: carboxylating nicotinate-nucleotide diphosphorylase [Verrucomicrobia bacterium]|nr:MAG: carboxylating nicotinate-nucleotide diphosphorylase [Verrucomicrobiota bacterium]
MNVAQHDWLIERALAEDIGSGDLTAEYFVNADRKATALLVSRQEGVIAGTELAEEVFRRVDPTLVVTRLIEDGARVTHQAIIMKIEGSARSILTAERTALNFMQRLSGIATQTYEYVKAVDGTKAKILDTRKTTPGWRFLEKAAVVCGGGTNHRMGLYDRVMVKDNHLVSEGGLQAMQASMQKLLQDHPEVEIEVEADHLDQVSDFLAMPEVDYILLDNMSIEQLRQAVEMRGLRTRPMLEASGGVTLESVRAIAFTGVDFISVGALTHSVKAMDLALDFVE